MRKGGKSLAQKHDEEERSMDDDNKVIPFPSARIAPAEPQRDEEDEPQGAQVFAYQGSAAPKGYVVLPKLIPPADRKRCPCPGCNDFAMYSFSWHLKDIDPDGEIRYIKVNNRLEITSCPGRGCIAWARNIVRRNFWNSTVYPVLRLLT